MTIIEKILPAVRQRRLDRSEWEYLEALGKDRTAVQQGRWEKLNFGEPYGTGFDPTFQG